MGIAQNIRYLRRIHDLSQKDFGKIAGVSDKAVSAWENGLKEPRMGAIQKIADHFNLQKSNIIEDGGLENNLVRSELPSALPHVDSRSRKQLEKILADDQLTYNGVVLGDEDREKLRRAIELAFWDIKEMNKRKK